MHFSASRFSFKKNYLCRMSDYQRSSGHTVSSMTAHIVWSTKYRYSVLQGDIKTRCRTIHNGLFKNYFLRYYLAL